jgi:hypothetical protein
LIEQKICVILKNEPLKIPYITYTSLQTIKAHKANETKNCWIRKTPFNATMSLSSTKMMIRLGRNRENNRLKWKRSMWLGLWLSKIIILLWTEQIICFKKGCNISIKLWTILLHKFLHIWQRAKKSQLVQRWPLLETHFKKNYVSPNGTHKQAKVSEKWRHPFLPSDQCPSSPLSFQNPFCGY